MRLLLPIAFLCASCAAPFGSDSVTVMVRSNIPAPAPSLHRVFSEPSRLQSSTDCEIPSLYLYAVGSDIDQNTSDPLTVSINDFSSDIFSTPSGTDLVTPFESQIEVPKGDQRQVGLTGVVFSGCDPVLTGDDRFEGAYPIVGISDAFDAFSPTTVTISAQMHMGGLKAVAIGDKSEIVVEETSFVRVNIESTPSCPQNIDDVYVKDLGGGFEMHFDTPPITPGGLSIGPLAPYRDYQFLVECSGPSNRAYYTTDGEADQTIGCLYGEFEPECSKVEGS